MIQKADPTTLLVSELWVPHLLMEIRFLLDNQDQHLIMVQCIFITEICSKSFTFNVFNEILYQFDIIFKYQNLHRQHDHQHKKLSRGKRKSDILLSKLILWENKIEINTKTLF